MDREPAEMAKLKPDEYCQKDKYDSYWSKHRKARDDHKETFNSKVTSAMEYGWREPLDTFIFNTNRSGMCKRTFHDVGHL